MSNSINCGEHHLDNWRSQAPPHDFAARVAEISTTTNSPLAISRPGFLSHSLIVPLVIAAILISAGAYAGRRLMADNSPQLTKSRGEFYAPQAQEYLRFGVPTSSIAAERELADKDNAHETTVRNPRDFTNSNFSKLSNQPPTTSPRPAEIGKPSRVPAPRCMCSTSGIVCSCFD